MFSFGCFQSHLDEIACITQSRDEAAELAKAVKMQIIEVQTFGRDLISNYQQEIADLEGMTCTGLLLYVVKM